MMEFGRVLKQLKLQPRRTIRIVLFTNEENGVRGAKAYAKDHDAELAKTVFALESDTGGGPPPGVTPRPKATPGGQAREGPRPRTRAPVGPPTTARGGPGHGRNPHQHG